jgi:hypothetical protein
VQILVVLILASLSFLGSCALTVGSVLFVAGSLRPSHTLGVEYVATIAAILVFGALASVVAKAR